MTGAAHVERDQLLERASELNALDGLVGTVAAGGSGVVLIEGPAGIGKTTLLAVAGETAADKGCIVLRARAGPLERASGFGMVRHLLDEQVARASRARQSELMSGAAELAAPVLGLPLPTRDGVDLSAPGDELVSMHGLYWLLARLAETAPLLLLIDEAQWADDVSLRWLLYLTRRLEGLPIGVVISVRTGEPDAGYALLDALTVEPGVTVLRPAPLSAAASAVLASRAHAGAVDDELAAAYHEWTGGNPLLVTELATELAARGVPPVSTSADELRTTIPRGIAQMTLQRLGRLPERAIELARAVALLGPDAELRHAAALADLTFDEAAAAADQLVSAHLLAGTGELDFVHPLIRGVVYDDIAAHRRSSDHKRAARLLDDESAGADLVGIHLLQSTPARDPWVVERLERAAEAELARGSSATAARMLDRALQEPVAVRDRSRLLLALASAQLLAQDPAVIGSLQAAIEAAEDGDDRVRASLAYARILLLAGQGAMVVDVVGPLLDSLDPDDDLALALGATHLAGAHMVPDLMAVADAHVARINARGALPTTAGARLINGQLAYHATMTALPVEQALSYARAAIDDGRLLRDYLDQAESLLVPISMIGICGELIEADRLYTDATDLAQRGGRLLTFAAVSGLRSWTSLGLGRLVDAEVQARDALDIAATSPMLGAIAGFARPHLVHALIDQGRIDDAVDALGPEPSLAEGDAFTWDRDALFAAGRLRGAQGRFADAADLLLACGRLHLHSGIVNPAFLPWGSAAALALHRLGSSETARDLATEELVTARRFEADRPIGVALTALGTITGGDDGLALLVEAVDTLRRTPAVLDLTAALIALGAARRRVEARTEATAVLREAYDLAVSLGARLLADDAAAELRRAGGRPAVSPRRRTDALTSSERRVAEMAADGLSNPQIAQALFVTRATVESHLHASYRKLGITARTHLAAALTDQDAIPA